MDGILFNIFFSNQLKISHHFSYQALVITMNCCALSFSLYLFSSFVTTSIFFAHLTVVTVLVQDQLICGDNQEFTFSNIDL